MSSADFDQSYEPVSPSYPPATGSAYTVRNGDTLKSVAQALWGDSSLWYLIAQANGLSSAQTLTAGQVLVIPNKLTNIHNNASTFRPYSPGEAIGHIDPTLPEPPPQPVSGGGGDDGGCGGLGSILVIAVAIVATVYTAGAAATYFGAAGGFSGGLAVMGGTAGLTATETIVIAAGSAAVGSVASQGVAMAIGMQQDFSWSQVGQAALGAGITAGVGYGLNSMAQTGGMLHDTPMGGWVTESSSWQGAALKAGVGSVISQAAHGGSFSWRQVAAASVSGAVATSMGGGKGQGFDAGNDFGAFATKLAASTVSGWTSMAINANNTEMSRSTLGGLFEASLGQAIGDSVVGVLGAREQDPLGDFMAQQDAAQVQRDSVAAAASASSLGNGLRLGGGQGLRFSGGALNDWSNGIDGGIMLNGSMGPSAAAPSSVRAGDFNGSLERIARAQLGAGASQRDINNYVGQLFEINGISNARAIGAEQQITLPSSDTAAATSGLAQYGRDMAVGELIKADRVAAAQAQGGGADRWRNYDDPVDLLGKPMTLSRAPGLMDEVIGVTQQIIENPRESLKYAGQGVVGLIKGAPNMVAEGLTQAAIGTRYLAVGGAELVGIASPGALDREIAQYRNFSGRLFEYDNVSQEAAGFVSGFAMPTMATKTMVASANAWRASINALSEDSFAMYQQVASSVDSAMYRLNPANYEWAGTNGSLATGLTPIGLKMSGPVEVRIATWASDAQKADYSLYTSVANEALDAGYLSPTGRVSTNGGLRILADREIAAERAAAELAGSPYKGVVGHGPDTTWTGKPAAYRWIDQDFRVNSSIGGQAGRYPLGFKPTQFILVGG